MTIQSPVRCSERVSEPIGPIYPLFATTYLAQICPFVYCSRHTSAHRFTVFSETGHLRYVGALERASLVQVPEQTSLHKVTWGSGSSGRATLLLMRPTFRTLFECTMSKCEVYTLDNKLTSIGYEVENLNLRANSSIKGPMSFQRMARARLQLRTAGRKLTSFVDCLITKHTQRDYPTLQIVCLNDFAACRIVQHETRTRPHGDCFLPAGGPFVLS